jgi:uncharacterized protein (TIGR02588 family)
LAEQQARQGEPGQGSHAAGPTPPAPAPPGGQEDEIPSGEWAVALLGVVLVVGALGFLGYEAVTRQDSPPDITVQVDSISPTRTGYLVQIRVLNHGGATAAALKVEGVLVDEAGSGETSETTIAYVPAHSERKGGLFFTKDPRQFGLRLRAQGYEAP